MLEAAVIVICIIVTILWVEKKIGWEESYLPYLFTPIMLAAAGGVLAAVITLVLV